MDHLESFKTLKHLQGVLNKIICQGFSIMLKGLARVWFRRLMPNSINTFKELSAQFASHFIRRYRYKRSIACLMSIKQREDKTLRSYITWLNKKAFSIDEANDKILVSAFTNGSWKGEVFVPFIKKRPKDHVRRALPGHQVHERRRCTTGSRGKAQEEGRKGRCMARERTEQL